MTIFLATEPSPKQLGGNLSSFCEPHIRLLKAAHSCRNILLFSSFKHDPFSSTVPSLHTHTHISRAQGLQELLLCENRFSSRDILCVKPNFYAVFSKQSINCIPKITSFLNPPGSRGSRVPQQTLCPSDGIRPTRVTVTQGQKEPALPLLMPMTVDVVQDSQPWVFAPFSREAWQPPERTSPSGKSTTPHSKPN